MRIKKKIMKNLKAFPFCDNALILLSFYADEEVYKYKFSEFDNDKRKIKSSKKDKPSIDLSIRFYTSFFVLRHQLTFRPIKGGLH